MKVIFETEFKTPEMAYNSLQAGIDLYLPENIIIPGKAETIVDLRLKWEPVFSGITGFIYKMLFKTYLQIKAKSGHAFKNGLEVTSAGVIDQDYRGTIKIKLFNTSENPFILNKDNAICQAIVFLLPKYKIISGRVNEKTVRGEKGFGSSKNDKM